MNGSNYVRSITCFLGVCLVLMIASLVTQLTKEQPAPTLDYLTGFTIPSIPAPRDPCDSMAEAEVNRYEIDGAIYCADSLERLVSIKSAAGSLYVVVEDHQERWRRAARLLQQWPETKRLCRDGSADRISPPRPALDGQLCRAACGKEFVLCAGEQFVLRSESFTVFHQQRLEDHLLGLPKPSPFTMRSFP